MRHKARVSDLTSRRRNQFSCGWLKSFEVQLCNFILLDIVFILSFGSESNSTWCRESERYDSCSVFKPLHGREIFDNLEVAVAWEIGAPRQRGNDYLTPISWAMLKVELRHFIYSWKLFYCLRYSDGFYCHIRANWLCDHFTEEALNLSQFKIYQNNIHRETVFTNNFYSQKSLLQNCFSSCYVGKNSDQYWTVNCTVVSQKLALPRSTRSLKSNTFHVVEAPRDILALAGWTKVKSFERKFIKR